MPGLTAFLDRMPPAQRRLVLLGVPVVAAVVIARAVRRPAPDDDAPTATGVIPGTTDAIGKGELAGWMQQWGDALYDVQLGLSELEHGGVNTPSQPPGTPAPIVTQPPPVEPAPAPADPEPAVGSLASLASSLIVAPPRVAGNTERGASVVVSRREASGGYTNVVRHEESGATYTVRDADNPSRTWGNIITPGDGGQGRARDRTDPATVAGVAALDAARRSSASSSRPTSAAKAAAAKKRFPGLDVSKVRVT